MEPEAAKGNANILQQVHEENIPKMLAQMRNNLPESIHAHEYVNMLLKYKRKNPNYEIAILAPGGDYRLGLIFYLKDEENRSGILIGSMYCENEEARKAMEEVLKTDPLKLSSYKMTLLSGLTNTSHLAIKPYMEKNNWIDTRGLMYWMPWEAASKLEVHVPEGVEIRDLNPDHAEIIDKVWPHRYPGSKEMIARQIKYNFGLGVFRGDDLLSWVIHFYYGGIGAVQTLDTEKRKGYAKVVVQSITKKLGEMKIDVHLNVLEENKPSIAFFKSLGFNFAFPCHWVSTPFTTNLKSDT